MVRSFTISNSRAPPGVVTFTVSPSSLLRKARPIGDVVEIRPLAASASSGSTSRKNRALARYRGGAAGELDGHILPDGPHLVGDALAAGIRIREAAVAAGGLDRAELRRLVEALAGHGAEVSAASPAVMDALSPVRSASAIVAIADRPPEAASRLYSGDGPLVVVADSVQDPGNL